MEDTFVICYGENINKEDFMRVLFRERGRLNGKKNIKIRCYMNDEKSIFFSKYVNRKSNKSNTLLQLDDAVVMSDDYQCKITGFDMQDDKVRNFKKMYDEYEEEMFKHLEGDLDYSVAIYDETRKKLLVCSDNNNGLPNLFYGYTDDGDIIFSNNVNVLKEICGKDIKIERFSPNQYFVNGEFFNFEKVNGNNNSTSNGNVVNNTDNNNDVNTSNNTSKTNNKTNNKKVSNLDFTNNIISIVEELVATVSNEKIGSLVDSVLKETLDSAEFKKKIINELDKYTGREAEKAALKLIKDTLQNKYFERDINKKLNDLFDKKMEEFSRKISLPQVNVIKLKDIELGRTDSEFFHKRFDDVLQLISMDEAVMLVGPAGSGKNHTVGQIAKGLGLDMYYTNDASNEYKLTGFIDAGGNYVPTEFYKAFKNGGIFFLDEIDCSDPSALIVMNSALANGYMAFPNEVVYKHPKFRMVAAANTWGKGGDLEYVGRNSLDASTLDRYDTVYFDYDRELEKKLYPNKEVLDFMWALRDAVEKNDMHHVVSTRGIGKVYKKYINKIPLELIFETNIIKNLSQDDINTLIGSMENIDSNNTFYKEFKKVKVGR